MRRLLVTGLFLIAVSFPSVARAQVTDITNSTSTPIPGAGHDYIKMLSESVDPANGSVSLRLEVPTPQGRGLTLPFFFAYDSGAVHVPGASGDTQTYSAAWLLDGFRDPLRSGGWGYTVPYVTSGGASVKAIPPYTGNCMYGAGYIFHDPEGGRHSLGLADQIVPTASACHNLRQWLSATGDLYQATFPSTGGLAIVSADGTVYGGQSGMQIEDRNGNQIDITFTMNANEKSSFNVTDTLKRPLLSSSGFDSPIDTMAVSGLSNPYTVTWGTATFNFTPAFTNTGGPGCNIQADNSSVPVIDTIALPNGQKYQFTYDTVFGQLSKVTYPSGGYVSYVWGYNPQAAVAYFAPTHGCVGIYDVPAIVKRYVSFDGQSIASEQDFSYLPTTWNGNKWTSKQTTVTTYDRVRGTSFQTVYTYSAGNPGEPCQPLDLTPSDNQIPVEQTVVYKDTSGSVLRTVTKGWYDAYELACELQTLENGLISGTFYAYGPGATVKDKKEYDYGLITSTSVCQNQSTAPSSITPSRETVVNYQSFSPTPIYPSAASIFDRQSSLITYGNGSRVAETDYSYDQGSTSSASATNHDETNYAPGSSAPRGNATTVTKQCFPSCTNAATTSTYDETGQVVSITDPCGNASCSDMTGTNHTTTYSYTDSYSNGTPPGNTNAYLTKVTRPATNGVAHISNYSYGYMGGQLTLAKDENQLSMANTYNDQLDRITETDYPDGGKTTYLYNDSVPSVTITKLATPDPSVVTVTTMDGMGHVIETQLTSDTSGVDNTVTTYDGLGKPYYVYNPTRCNPPTTNCGPPTWGYAAYTYDALGRVTRATHRDGTFVQTSYNGRATRVSDEGNGTSSVVRISQVDGLGRLASICEVSSITLTNGSGGSPTSCGQDISATGFLTTYQYDGLDNLIQVNQGSLSPRKSVYDSLSRLTSSTNPEANTVPGATTIVPTTYSYDADGNVIQRIAPAPDQQGTATVTTTYTYDALNRLTYTSYNDGRTPVGEYTYDQCSFCSGTTTNGIGRLVHESNQVNAASTYAYDPMGRIAQRSGCIPLNCNDAANVMTTTYDYLGDATSVTNSMGVKLSYQYNGAAELTTLTSSLNDANHPSPLFSGPFYNATALTSVTLGNGLYETRAYDSHLRLVSVADGSAYSFSTFYAPDGDVLTANDSANGNWIYSYDDFSRLISATNSTQNLAYTNGYDRYGNRWQQYLGGACTAGTTFCLTFDNNNRVNNGSLVYDTAGNVTQDSMHHYYYDAENRLIQVDGTLGTCSTTCYVYFPDGKRAEKNIAGVRVDYLYDTAGRQNTEVNSSLGWNRIEVYAGGTHLATYTGGATGATYFNHADWLGTERARTTVPGVLCETISSLPFGDGISTSGSCGDPSPLHFTGQERDTETHLDNFEARYMASSLGRFMSPDPSNALVLRVVNPQRWNQYGYAIDNPLSYRDPTGRDAAAVNFSGMVAGQGHEALLIIDKSGTATFASFGPKHGVAGGLGGAGEISTTTGSATSTTTLPQVEFGANGLPTAESYTALVNALAAIENVDPNTVRVNYFQTSEADTQTLKNWVDAQRNLAAAGQGPFGQYNVCYNNCANFTLAGLFVGHALSQDQIKSLGFPRPNSLYDQLSQLANESFQLANLARVRGCTTIQGPNGPITKCD